MLWLLYYECPIQCRKTISGKFDSLDFFPSVRKSCPVLPSEQTLVVACCTVVLHKIKNGALSITVTTESKLLSMLIIPLVVRAMGLDFLDSFLSCDVYSRLFQNAFICEKHNLQKFTFNEQSSTEIMHALLMKASRSVGRDLGCTTWES